MQTGAMVQPWGRFGPRSDGCTSAEALDATAAIIWFYNAASMANSSRICSLELEAEQNRYHWQQNVMLLVGLFEG